MSDKDTVIVNLEAARRARDLVKAEAQPAPTDSRWLLNADLYQAKPGQNLVRVNSYDDTDGLEHGAREQLWAAQLMRAAGSLNESRHAGARPGRTVAVILLTESYTRMTSWDAVIDVPPHQLRALMMTAYNQLVETRAEAMLDE